MSDFNLQTGVRAEGARQRRGHWRHSTATRHRHRLQWRLPGYPGIPPCIEPPLPVPAPQAET